MRERRDDVLRRAGKAHAALLDPAFDDAAFRRQYAAAVGAALAGDSEGASMLVFERLLRDLQRFVALKDDELAQEALGKKFFFDVGTGAGRTHDEAMDKARAAAALFSTAPRFQSRQYPIAPGNPAFLDQRATLHQPIGLSSAQRDEVRQLIDDVLAERPRRGRPVGLDMSPEEFRAAFLRTVADLKRGRRGQKPSQRRIATDMVLTEYQLRNYLARYGDPRE